MSWRRADGEYVKTSEIAVEEPMPLHSVNNDESLIGERLAIRGPLPVLKFRCKSGMCTDSSLAFVVDLDMS